MSSSKRTRYADLTLGDTLIDSDRTYVVVALTDERIHWLSVNDGDTLDTLRSSDRVVVNSCRLLLRMP